MKSPPIIGWEGGGIEDRLRKYATAAFRLFYPPGTMLCLESPYSFANGGDMILSNNEKEANNRIGQRIQLARDNQGMTLLELCDALTSDCTCQQLEEYELGLAIIPAVHLNQLARVLEMPVEFFVQDVPLLDWTGEWRLLQTVRELNPNQRRRLTRFIVDIARDAATSPMSLTKTDPSVLS